MALFFVSRVIAPRAVGTRDPEIEFLLIEKIAGQVCSSRTNRHDAGSISSHARRELQGLATFRGSHDENRISSAPAGELHCHMLKISWSRSDLITTQLSRKPAPGQIQIRSYSATPTRTGKLHSQ